jgi:hypothetical protein
VAIAGRLVSISPRSKKTAGSAAGLRFHAMVYSEVASPAWYIGKEHDNVSHELVVVGVRGRYAMICASDGGARDRIVRMLKSANPLPPAALSGFVGTDAAAIWLKACIRRQPSRRIRSS